MSLQDGVKAIRRLWPVLVACGVVAGVVMWIITPVAVNTERKVASFDAIATLLVTAEAPLVQPPPRPGSESGSSTPTRTPTPTPSPTLGVTDVDRFLALNRVALLVRTGEIPRMAAQRLDYRGDPAVLAQGIRVRADGSSRAVTIWKTSKDSGPAVQTVNAFAEATVAYFGGPGRYTGVDVSLLEEATALPRETTVDYVAPPSKWHRTLIAAVIGLLLGVGLVFIVDRLNPRLRGRRKVAEALALPVLAEVSRSRHGALYKIAVLDAPRSPEADGYRVLKSAVLHARQQSVGVEGRSTAYVIIVTALVGDADEPLVNLAVALADDLRVLVVDGDLRAPGLHHWLDVPDSEGVTDFLADSDAELSVYARPTRLPGVRLITAGSSTSQPGFVVSQMPKAVAAAGEIADVLIIKAPSLLVASEVFDLVPIADMTLVVVRSGRLESPAALRARDLLHRFPHTDVGVVLVGQ